MSEPQGNAVQLRYNGVIFESSVKTDQLTARTPCPLVSISTESNKDIDNNILYDRTTITLEGIILSSGKTDFLTQAYTGVVNYFRDERKQNSVFEIVCGTRTGSTFTPSSNGFIQFSGTSFVSSNADKSDNNWYLTIPYTVVLESISSRSDSLIESYEDSWTIEPLEDISYYNIYSDTINSYQLPSLGTSSFLPADQPNPYTNSNPGSLSVRNNTPPSIQKLSVNQNIVGGIESNLQYRITHRISAVGKASKRSDPNNPSFGGAGTIITNNTATSAYENAAIWVNNRVKNSIIQDSPINQPPKRPTGVALSAKLTDTITTGPNIGLFLYNHIRSIESSPSAGSYGITDTWLALGTGVGYTEEFTWEVSVDDKWVHTISMNGTIKGLEKVSNSPSSTFQSQSTDTIAGYTILSGKDIAATGFVNGVGNELIRTKFPNQTRSNSKYQNAIAAYATGIKPYLYARAGHALNTIKMPPVVNQALNVPSTQQMPYTPKGATWFGPEIRPLNIIPITTNETFNPAAGTVTYSISYDNRPACILPGALNATLSVTDTNPTDLVAEAFILGRPLGPILEKVGTSKSERQLSLEVLYPMPTGFRGLHPQSPQCVVYHTNEGQSAEYKYIVDLVDAFKPVGAKAFATFGSTAPYYFSQKGQIFKTSDSETWSPFEGRYTRNITWIYNTGTCL